MQRNGAGIHSASDYHWDLTEDSFVTVHWPNEKQRDTNNSRMICIVTVAGMKL